METCKELEAFTSINPFTISKEKPGKLYNLVEGKWKETKEYQWVKDPLTGDNIIQMPKTSVDELKEVAESMKKCPKSGLHNPLKNVDRYVLYGKVCQRASELLHNPIIQKHFAKLNNIFIPKSDEQSLGEVKGVMNFLDNFSGDNVRFLASTFQYPGDHEGQFTTGYRWPYGPVIIISPFNFPFRIPALQLLGALFMGNKVLIKPHSKTTAVMEEFVRLLIYSGMPPTDVNLLHISGPVLEKIYSMVDIRMTQFTGSSDVAEKLSEVTHGKIKMEDSGFDWKILGPDVSNPEVIAYQCDQDAYALSGQKCSAEKMLFIHSNWLKPELNLLNKLKEKAECRSLAEKTISPLLSIRNKEILGHIDQLIKMDGSKVLYGGKPLENHRIPEEYGSFYPTGVFVPLKHFQNPESLKILTREIFGPFQIITEYGDQDIATLLAVLESITLHLTAAIVSNIPEFNNKVIGHSVNGYTYIGQKARTTGSAAYNHYGPSGDPRAAGLGSPNAIRYTWSCHREIVTDELMPATFVPPKPT